MRWNMYEVLIEYVDIDLGMVLFKSFENFYFKINELFRNI